MARLFFSWAFLLFLSNLSAQVFLQSPVEGNQGEDWIIVNYVDWELEGYSDYQCGSKSYDGHQGTDYTLASFKAMDDSVDVLAAAAGTVTFIQDGLFDRETDGDVTKRLGNYIAISHPNDYYTYYGHLMTNSIRVQVGDEVEAGDLIGYIGSSGNSTDPHLHFELWFDSMFVVDPFLGPCGNPETRLMDPPAYDTSLVVWDQGMHVIDDLGINDLRERITTIEPPYRIAPSSDSLLYYWGHLYGLREGKEVTIRWFTPNDVEWFDFSVTLDRDYWYYYFWSYINHDNLELGEWTVRLYYEEQEITTQTFIVEDVAVNTTDFTDSNCKDYEQWPLQKLYEQSNLDIRVFSSNGHLVSPTESTALPTGVYFVEIQEGNQRCVFKKWLE